MVNLVNIYSWKSVFALFQSLKLTIITSIYLSVYISFPSISNIHEIEETLKLKSVQKRPRYWKQNAGNKLYCYWNINYVSFFHYLNLGLQVSTSKIVAWELLICNKPWIGSLLLAFYFLRLHKLSSSSFFSWKFKYKYWFSDWFVLSSTLSNYYFFKVKIIEL